MFPEHKQKFKECHVVVPSRSAVRSMYALRIYFGSRSVDSSQPLPFLLYLVSSLVWHKEFLYTDKWFAYRGPKICLKLAFGVNISDIYTYMYICLHAANGE